MSERSTENTRKASILVVEDEEKIAQILVDYLERENYQVKVLSTGTEAVETIRSSAPDLLILDLMLPGKDGLTICREVREFSRVPIMMLTARVDEIDRLLGLELGADDYVCKPFSPREVVARIRAILRRLEHVAPMQTDGSLTYREITLDVSRFECRVNSTVVELTPVELRMLQGFITQPGRVFSRDQLMDVCYADERVVSDRTIDTHIKNLRRKLAKENGDEELIHSIYGVGYKID